MPQNCCQAGGWAQSALHLLMQTLGTLGHKISTAHHLFTPSAARGAGRAAAVIVIKARVLPWDAWHHRHWTAPCWSPAWVFKRHMDKMPSSNTYFNWLLQEIRMAKSAPCREENHSSLVFSSQVSKQYTECYCNEATACSNKYLDANTGTEAAPSHPLQKNKHVH